jgi:hypothetical protein
MKDFIPYELALELKELGFDEPCFGLYSIIEHDDINIGDFYFGPSYATRANEGRSILAPTFSQAFRWFREKYNIFPNISYVGKFMNTFEILNEKGDDYTSGEIFHYYNTYFHYYNTYKEAELACLNKLIEIVKNGTK